MIIFYSEVLAGCAFEYLNQMKLRVEVTYAYRIPIEAWKHTVRYFP